MSYLLGIDLGTTYTAAAVLRMRAGEAVTEPEMVALGTRGSEMPSVVLAGEDGSLLVGDAAERRAMVEPDRVAREFKRRIGDPTPVSLGAGALPAEELTGVLVRHVVDVAAAREGGLPERITITHPASWGSHKLDLLSSAVDEALAGTGVPAVTLLAEPQAAAVCYAAAERVEPGSTIAVYDLGGGTFDAAVVRKGVGGSEHGSPGGFTLLGRPEGVEYLGGVDFDEVVFEHVRAGAPDAFAALDESDPTVWASVARLRRECREAKEALSADTEVAVPVWLPGGGAQTVVRLHRGEFEELIGPRIEDTVDVLRRAVESADLDAASVTSVLLVGGSSRIPLVAQTVSEQLGRPVAVDEDPKNAIARGAALAALGRPTSWPAVRVPVQSAAPAESAGERTGPVRTVSVAPAFVDDAPTERIALPAHGSVPAAGDSSHVTREVGPAGSPDNRARWLIGAGGLVGALALLAVVLFWPVASVTLDGASARSIVPDTVAPTTPPPVPAAPSVTQAPAAVDGGDPTKDPTEDPTKDPTKAARSSSSGPVAGPGPVAPAPIMPAPAGPPAGAPGGGPSTGGGPTTGGGTENGGGETGGGTDGGTDGPDTGTPADPCKPTDPATPIPESCPPAAD